MAYGKVNTKFLEELIKQDAKEYHLIDVRPPEYYAEGHIPGAVNVSMLEAKQSGGDAAQIMADALESMGIAKDDPVYIYCQDGRLAAEADALISSKGFTHTYLYESCFPEWAEDPSHPIEK